MQPVPENLLKQFAMHFAYKTSGFRLQDITPHFEKYQPGLPSPGFDGITPKKGDHFVRVVASMDPRLQRYALADLCNSPPNLKNCPDEQTRRELLLTLLASDGINPLSVRLSTVSLAAVKEAWWSAASCLDKSPSAAVTAARTLLETTCKTILHELKIELDNSWDLNRLVRKTREGLGLSTGDVARQAANELASGLAAIVNAVAALSNSAGVRHGTVHGITLNDRTVASLCVHAAGTLAHFIVQRYLDTRLSQQGDSTTS